MPIRKFDPYSSLWASCDELRGSMGASQHKKYVFVLLFVKYISYKFAGQPYAEVAVPAGASFFEPGWLPKLDCKIFSDQIIETENPPRPKPVATACNRHALKCFLALFYVRQLTRC